MALRFAVVSDMSEFSGDGSYDDSLYFKGVCEKIAALSTPSNPINFIVATGNLGQVSSTIGADYTIKDVLGNSFIWYPVVGNEDKDSSPELNWIINYFPGIGSTVYKIVNDGPPGYVETNYSFDWENCHFVVINVYMDTFTSGNGGGISDDLSDWLLEDLQANEKPHVFVFGHTPLCSFPDNHTFIVKNEDDILNQDNGLDKFIKILRKYKAIYVSGHSTNFNWAYASGIWNINNGHSRGKGSVGVGETLSPSTFLIFDIDEDRIDLSLYRDDSFYLLGKIAPTGINYSNPYGSSAILKRSGCAGISFKSGIKPNYLYNNGLVDNNVQANYSPDTIISENNPTNNVGDFTQLGCGGDSSFRGSSLLSFDLTKANNINPNVNVTSLSKEFKPDVLKYNSVTDTYTIITDVNASNQLFSFSSVVDDAIYFGQRNRFNRLDIRLSIPGVGSWNFAYEYWNGTSWVSLVNVVDGTNEFTTANISNPNFRSITFNLPFDWQPLSVNNISDFWIRIRFTLVGSINSVPTSTGIKLRQRATVRGASLTVDVDEQSPNTYEIFDVLRNWFEDQATWNKYDSSNNWSLPGAKGINDANRTWSQEIQTIIQSDNSGNDAFGYSCAISSSFIIAGAPTHNHSSIQSGSAYAFIRNSFDNYSEHFEFLPFDRVSGDGVGLSVGTTLSGSDNLALICAPSKNFGNISAVGSAYAYKRNGTTWDLESKLLPLDPSPGKYFGNSCAIDGDTMVIGMAYDSFHNTNSGAVFLYKKINGTWYLDSKIYAPSPYLTNEFFGASVALQGDNLFVGAPSSDPFGTLDIVPTGTTNGTVYFYRRVGGVWPTTPTQTIAPVIVQVSGFIALFGYRISLDGDKIVVGAPFQDGPPNRGGRIYVYKEIAGVWTLEQGPITPPPGFDQIVSFFGASVSISGDYIGVGQPYYSLLGDDNAGLAHVFKFNGATWDIKAIISESTPAVNNGFGENVGIYNYGANGSTFVVSAQGNDEIEDASGAVYVYHTSIMQDWGSYSTKKILPNDLELGGHFSVNPSATPYRNYVMGRTLKIRESKIIVSARQHVSGGGIVYVLNDLSGVGDWSTYESIKLQNGEIIHPSDSEFPTSGFFDQFSFDVDIDNDQFIATSVADDNEGGIDAGSVYIFNLDDSGATHFWFEKQKIINQGINEGPIDFGWSCAIRGDTAVIGAILGNSDTIDDCGAAYVFERNAGTWVQTAKLNASDAAPFDIFGYSVDVSIEEDTIAIGAPGNGTDGAVYVFKKSGSIWPQTDKISISPSIDANFGYSVSFANAGFITIGAPFDEDEDGNDSGSVYTYFYSGSSWVLFQKINSTNSASGDAFGNSVSMSMNFSDPNTETSIIVGSFLKETNVGLESGTAYIYNAKSSELSWVEKAKIYSNDISAGHRFGQSVDIGIISNRFIGVVGSPINNSCHIFDNNFRTTAGSNYTANNTKDEPMAKVILPSSIKGRQIIPFTNDGLSVIQTWVDNVNDTNNGIIIRNYSNIANTALIFKSSESDDVNHHPELSIMLDFVDFGETFGEVEHFTYHYGSNAWENFFYTPNSSGQTQASEILGPLASELGLSVYGSTRLKYKNKLTPTAFQVGCVIEGEESGAVATILRDIPQTTPVNDPTKGTLILTTVDSSIFEGLFGSGVGLDNFIDGENIISCTSGATQVLGAQADGELIYNSMHLEKGNEIVSRVIDTGNERNKSILITTNNHVPGSGVPGIIYVRGRKTKFSLFADEKNQENNEDRGPRWIVYSRDPADPDPAIAFPVITEYKIREKDTVTVPIDWRYIQIKLNR